MASEAGVVLNDALRVQRTTLTTAAGMWPMYGIPWPDPPVNTAPQTPEEACPLRIVSTDQELQAWSYIVVVERDGVVVDIRAPRDDRYTPDAMRTLVEALRPR